MQPTLGVHEMQEDFSNRPLRLRQPLIKQVVGTRVKQRAQLLKVLGQRASDVYKVSDDVYLNLFPASAPSPTVSISGDGGTTDCADSVDWAPFTGLSA